MKFADRLFFSITALLATIFMVLGIWFLTSYFQKNLDRELKQAQAESRAFQMMIEVSCQSLAEYGEEYAIKSSIDRILEGLQKNDVDYYIWSEEESYYQDTGLSGEGLEGLFKIKDALKQTNSYAYGIRKMGDRYYLLNVCRASINGKEVYLGAGKEITGIYEDREKQMNQYRLALFLLLFAGGGCIYLLSYYLTRPIRELGVVAEEITRGNYERRSRYHRSDEIGILANSFNRMADRLLKQMQDRELEAKQKESFTAAFAHELKTPLTSIIGYADMLNTVAMSEEECREAYYYIYTQGKRLERLSHKLLELVSIDRAELEIKPIQTKELEDAVRAAIRPLFAQKKIMGKITMERGILYGDRDLLLSVFYNLLDNAMKATKEGDLILFKGSRLENGYEVKVTDNGRGIPKEEISRITEAFYMVDKSRSRKEGGAGIGMTLCQKIVALHKGELQIHSQLGEGTIIRLFFPDEGGSEP